MAQQTEHERCRPIYTVNRSPNIISEMPKSILG